MKLSIKYSITLALTVLLWSNESMAKTIDTSAQEKDMRIMSGILESSLQDAANDFPGRPNIKTTYLAGQGYLFTVRLNGLGSFGIPGLASWDGGRLEVDIPELIEEAFTAINYAEDMPGLTEREAMIEVEREISNESGFNATSEKAQEYQAQLKELREQQRELRRDMFEQSRDIRRAEDENKRDDFEKTLAKTKAALEDSKNKYEVMLKKYRSERQSKQINSSQRAIKSILTTLCDYGATLKALDSDEKFNLLVMGAVTPDGESADQMFIFSQKDIKRCNDSEKLQNNALYYTL